MCERIRIAQGLGLKLYEDSSLATQIMCGRLEFFEWRDGWKPVQHAPFDHLTLSEEARLNQARTLDDVYLVIQEKALSRQLELMSLREQVDEAVTLLFSLAGRIAALSPEEGSQINEAVLSLLSVKSQEWRVFFRSDGVERYQYSAV